MASLQPLRAPRQSAFGKDAYATIALKAAALMQSLAQNQPFVDGKIRIAWICGKVFLQLHGLKLRATDREGLDLFLNRIATGMSVEDLAGWLDRHISPEPASLFRKNDTA
jgi:death-on-curing protein